MKTVADELKAYLKEMAQTWPDSDADIVQRKASLIEAGIPPDCTDPHLISALKSAKLARKFGLTVKGVDHIRDAFDAWGEYEKEQHVLPHARRGKKTLDATKKGHERVHGTDEQKAARWGEYQLEVDRLHKRNPALSYDAIKNMVAEKFKVSPKTIQRHTTNPKRN